MVELVDTQDLKSCSRKRSAGSIPALSTIYPTWDLKSKDFLKESFKAFKLNLKALFIIVSRLFRP